MKAQTSIELRYTVFSKNDDWDPKELINIVKFEKYNAWIKGKSISNGEYLKIPETVFEYSSGPVYSLDVSLVTDAFCRQIKWCEEELADYIVNKKLDSYISIVVRAWAFCLPAIILELNFLNLASKLNCSVDIPLYIYEKENDVGG